MSFLSDINTYWYNNSTLNNALSYNSVYSGLVPDSLAFPYAVLTPIALVPTATTGQGYIATFTFQISVYDVAPDNVEYLAEVIRGQFDYQTIATSTIACERTNGPIFAADQTNPQRTYYAVLTYDLLANLNFNAGIVVSSSSSSAGSSSSASGGGSSSSMAQSSSSSSMAQSSSSSSSSSSAAQSSSSSSMATSSSSSSSSAAQSSSSSSSMTSSSSSSSSSSTVNPQTILGSNLWAWYRADLGTWQNTSLTTPAVNNGDPVGGWVDQSGNNYNLLQATGSKQPTLELNDINGLPAIRFNGTSTYLATASFSALSATTIVIVMRPTSVTGQSEIFDGLSNPNRNLVFVTSSAYHWLAGNNITGPAATANSWAILNVVFNGTNSLFHVNGGTDATGNPGSDTLTGITVGSGYGGMYYLPGDIAEIIVATGAMSNTVRTQLDQYCDGRYNIY